MEFTMAKSESATPLFKGQWKAQGFTGISAVVQTNNDYWQPANVEERFCALYRSEISGLNVI